LALRRSRTTRRLALTACLLSTVPAIPAQAGGLPMAEHGEYVKACGICHLEAGEGVPGAFPPLDERMTRWSGTEQGRRYLVNVVVNGVNGQLEVNGVSYFSAMPGMAHQLTSGQMAALLNFVIVQFGDGEAVFTESSLDEIRTTNGAVSSLGLRPN
jgi:mono/diheme cytochrome c family protein